MNVKMESGRNRETLDLRSSVNGLTDRLLQQFRRQFKGMAQAPPRLVLIERIALAPRQSLALVEAEGQQLLIATSPESAPVFYALGGALRTEPHSAVRIS